MRVAGTWSTSRKERLLNVWKPIALLSITACVLFAGQSRAGADTTSVATGPDTTPVAQAQPHMAAALAALRVARAELDKAEHDKGGWRVAAIRETTSAIGETERGVQFDVKH
jgi:hypothetical protein